MGTFLAVLFLILLPLAAVGWVAYLYYWLTDEDDDRYVYDDYGVCPYCPNIIRPGDRLYPGPKGMGHFQCVR